MEQSAASSEQLQVLTAIKPTIGWGLGDYTLLAGTSWLTVRKGTFSILRLQGREQLLAFGQLLRHGLIEPDGICPGDWRDSATINGSRLTLAPSLTYLQIDHHHIDCLPGEIVQIYNWLALIFNWSKAGSYHQAWPYKVAIARDSGALALELRELTTDRPLYREELNSTAARELRKNLLTTAADPGEKRGLVLTNQDLDGYIEVCTGERGESGSLRVGRISGVRICPLSRQEMVLMAVTLELARR